MTTKGHCESSLGSFDELQNSAQAAVDPQTKPPDLGCESACSQAAIVYKHHRHLLLLLSPKSWYSFTVAHRVEGWVDLLWMARPLSQRHGHCLWNLLLSGLFLLLPAYLITWIASSIPPPKSVVLAKTSLEALRLFCKTICNLVIVFLHSSSVPTQAGCILYV